MIDLVLLLLANHRVRGRRIDQSDLLLHDPLDVLGQVESEVHVGSLLELALTDVALLAIVLWAGNPANAVVLVEVTSRLNVLFGD